MRTCDFDFDLPSELVAQQPAPKRDESRLLVLHRASGKIEHRRFGDLTEYLREGDVLVLNDSRVIPARLRGINAKSGGQFEVLLLEENAPNDWWVMLRPGKRARIGTRIVFERGRGGDGSLPLEEVPKESGDEAVPTPVTESGDKAVPTPVSGVVVETNEEGHRRLKFTGVSNILNELETLGEVPLPPYIRREEAPSSEEDRARYQTVFAGAPGSVAAPTAGLHFTELLLERIRAMDVQVCFLTLHVGLGTFTPVKTETVAAHVMHEERFGLGEEAAGLINKAKQDGRRVIAVGTTTLRVLESLARGGSDGSDPPSPRLRRAGRSEESVVSLPPGKGRTQIFIYPPFRFQVVDALLTNFHLPRSTLLMLASAFAAPRRTNGREVLLKAYAEAIRERYRFFSYGDAMLLL
ncbi:MAG: tRNA preQ1(34) S-adenosylmethionine ribosyltransferase-isomerase QueA [Verrucomicrobia bacterium]|nr:MAG: tRNA preQ1(34) S-adenosylmethionine ribosyltransferase-isomerase QueA [Verrucomicrobiota bacterium]